MPFRPEQLDAIQTVVTHDNCADGLVSAMILRDALHEPPEADEVEVLFLTHNTEAHRTLAAKPGMLFVDFPPPTERVQEFVKAGALILDHHRSAKEVVEAFGNNGVFGDEEKNPGVCGAVLAYEHVWIPKTQHLKSYFRNLDPGVKRMATLAGIRDTWQRQDPLWDEACAQQQTLTFVPKQHWMEKELAQILAEWPAQYSWVGKVLMDRQNEITRRAVEGGCLFQTTKGTRVVMFNNTEATSDAAEAIGATADLVIGFSYLVENGRPLLLISMRSHTNFDCAALAKAKGGGGHTRAAGFQLLLDPGEHVRLLPSPNPYSKIYTLLEEWENRP